MFVLITYDVKTETAAGRKRLHKIAKVCTNYGQRVQNSVFECNIEPALFVRVKEQLIQIMNDEEDSIRFYYLGNKYAGKTEQYGCKPSYDSDGPLII